jgi:hypothetical protein
MENYPHQGTFTLSMASPVSSSNGGPQRSELYKDSLILWRWIGDESHHSSHPETQIVNKNISALIFFRKLAFDTPQAIHFIFHISTMPSSSSHRHSHKASVNDGAYSSRSTSSKKRNGGLGGRKSGLRWICVSNERWARKGVTKWNE